jgi:hypothetical protein
MKKIHRSKKQKQMIPPVVMMNCFALLSFSDTERSTPVKYEKIAVKVNVMAMMTD